MNSDVAEKVGIRDSRHPKKRVTRNVFLSIARALPGASPKEFGDDGHSAVYSSMINVDH